MSSLIPKYKVQFSVDNPFRDRRPATDKIIFLSCEGSVTEEEYFEHVSRLFDELKHKIRFVSVAEDEIHTAPKVRTAEQKKKLSQSKPKQLYEKIEQFKIEKNHLYQFDAHKEDEFWIVMDIDRNLEDDFREDFIDTLDKCDQKGYGYAISNPFFEMWLLLHHAEPIEEDSQYAVTSNHAYEKTSYYRERLRQSGAPLHGNSKKQINGADYTVDNIKLAVKRAEGLHTDRSGRYPEYYATTVYRLINKILEISSGEVG